VAAAQVVKDPSGLGLFSIGTAGEDTSATWLAVSNQGTATGQVAITDGGYADGQKVAVAEAGQASTQCSPVSLAIALGPTRSDCSTSPGTGLLGLGVDLWPAVSTYAWGCDYKYNVEASPLGSAYSCTTNADGTPNNGATVAPIGCAKGGAVAVGGTCGEGRLVGVALCCGDASGGTVAASGAGDATATTPNSVALSGYGGSSSAGEVAVSGTGDSSACGGPAPVAESPGHYINPNVNGSGCSGTLP
jgi:hypothetical protein